jgi:hypothetical protein
MGKYTSCTRKRRYDTKRQARTNAKLMHKKYLGRYKAYKCKHCNGWHVGHNRPENTRVKTRRNI